MNKRAFDEWNEKKKKTHKRKRNPYFQSGEIWWAQLGKNISTEIDGKGEAFLRPIIILQKVYGNACLAIPLTTQTKNGDYYYNFTDTKQQHQTALLTQVRYLDGKRLQYKQSSMPKQKFYTLIDQFIQLIKKQPHR